MGTPSAPKGRHVKVMVTEGDMVGFLGGKIETVEGMIVEGTVGLSTLPSLP